MAGTIVFVIILVIVMPVGILMGFGALAGLVSHLAKTAVDADHEGTEMMTVASANPWAGPAATDTEADTT